MNLARFADGEFYQDDPSKRGFIRVEFHGSIITAYPSNETMWLSIPSREWIEKYGDSVWALIEQLEDDPRYYSWVGIAILSPPQTDDEDFAEWLADYPYVRMYFTENWKYIFNDTEGRNTYRIKHEDGTVVLIDRTTGAETIRIFDGVNGHEVLLDPDQIRITHGKTGAVITFDADGNISVQTPDEVRIQTGGKTIVESGGDAEVSVNGDVSVTVQGDAQINAQGQVQVQASRVQLIGSNGVVTAGTICPYTGFNHFATSTRVKASQ